METGHSAWEQLRNLFTIVDSPPAGDLPVPDILQGRGFAEVPASFSAADLREFEDVALLDAHLQIAGARLLRERPPDGLDTQGQAEFTDALADARLRTLPSLPVLAVQSPRTATETRTSPAMHASALAQWFDGIPRADALAEMVADRLLSREVAAPGGQHSASALLNYYYFRIPQRGSVRQTFLRLLHLRIRTTLSGAWTIQVDSTVSVWALDQDWMPHSRESLREFIARENLDGLRKPFALVSPASGG
jgi:hypothetical protein